MAGENSELTFVRCPSCRSLVPAISTKCRMCGATFENNQSEDDKSKGQSGRARQHTGSISAASEELELPTTKTAPPPPPTASFKSTKSEAPSNGLDIDDPLRNFLEEVEADEEQQAPVAAKPNGAPFEPAPKAPVAPQREAKPTPPPPASPPKPTQPAPQVTVESGRGRPGGLSFGKPDNRGDSRSDNRGENREARKPEVQPAPQAEPRREQRPQPAPQKPNFQPRAEAPRPAPQAQPNQERREERQPERRVEAPKPPSSKVVIHEGDLVGWLVDYRDPRGLGVEIRESQFFISRERLKPSDMILDDESISTPHAMVRITRQNGVEIQDLMSESGIRVRRRDSNSWQTVEERVKLQHGDRVQFGSIEYLIVLVPVE